MCLKGKWRQLGYALIINSALISAGGVIGWSVEVPRIADDPLKKFNLTKNSEEWLVASAGLSSLVSSVVAGWLVETIGPCHLIHWLLLPVSISWIVMATSNSLAWIMVGRIVTGSYVQLVIVTTQPFLAELSEPDIRGALSCLLEVFLSLGTLIMYIFARFLTWQNGTLISGILMFPVMALYLYVPESPYWYIRKSKFKEATRSLSRVRSIEHNNESEIRAIKEAVVDSRMMKGTFLEQVQSLKEPANYRPTLLLAVMFIVREMSGAMVLLIYAPFFFEAAGVPTDPFTATILMGLARFVFNFVAASVIDLVGRRILLIISSVTCALMMLITGFVLKFPYPFLSWIPLTAVIIFISAFGLGNGPIPWVLLGEILPTPVRSLASSICNVIFCIMFYLEGFFFPDLVMQFGLSNLVLVFALFNAINGLIVWLFLPETRQRTLEDLQTSFVGAALRPFKNHREGYLQPYGTTYATAKVVT